MLKLLNSCNLVEKVLVGILTLVILISSLQIGQTFYYSASQPAPGHGGTFVEGVVGSFSFINPVLAQTDLDRDLTSLVFAGLTRFDPVSNNIINDLATHTLSQNKLTYTFTLRDDLFWHDGLPVTADDVVFTFKDIIQNEAFPNPTLAADFANVEIQKIDDRTVEMKLKKPYAFFIYNTTVGLLPKHILSNIPISELLTASFNLRPIGCGPYKIDTLTSNAIQLVAFEKYHSGEPYLSSIIFKIFDSKEQLTQNIDGVTATKDLSEETLKSLKNDARLNLHDFTLPQYVALFFNTQSPILGDKKLRLGLQLATDKQAIVDKLSSRAQIIDTPLLEIANSDWKYEFDAARADGALFDAGWKYRDNNTVPQTTTEEKTSTTNPSTNSTLVEKIIPSAAGETLPADHNTQFITSPSAAEFYATGETSFYVRGKTPTDSTQISVNDYQLKKFEPSKGTWSYKADIKLGTLKQGENSYKISNQNGEFDHITIFYSPDETERTIWLAKKTNTTPALVKKKSAEETPAPTPETEKAAIKKILTNQPYRYNGDNMLTLQLLIPKNRPELLTVAEEVAQQWKARGVKLTIENLEEADFLRRLNKRDYDIVLFGENLGYNLDTYSFWHSNETRENGNNLSNLKSSSVNAYLEQVRASFDSSERRKRLALLREALGEEVPGVMLYTPTYSYAVDSKIKNFNLGRIALKRDRLTGAATWYLREAREPTGNLGVWNFFKWFFTEAL